MIRRGEGGRNAQAPPPPAPQDRKREADAQEQLPPYAQGVLQQVSQKAQGANRTTAKPRATSTSSARSESPAQAAAAVRELQQGATVIIEDCICQITDALGMGSFGTVWAAEDQNTGAKLAVKEISCWTHNELMNALFERHLLSVLSAAPMPVDPTGAAPTPAQLPGMGQMPALVGHEVLCLKPKRMRLAMTRVPGVALEDFLEERRCLAAATAAAGISVSPRERFSEACEYAHGLVAQLAPVFERISAIAIHRDVNTHNILINASPGTTPYFGLVDFGLAVDTQCWCSTEDNPETKWRPTRVGLDAVHTWRYLDIAGDCRYWPVSAWTQFLIGWKEIDANTCLRTEYQIQLDQHALGITAMKVFVELLSPPSPREPREGDPAKAGSKELKTGCSVESSDIPNLQMEIWTLLRAWERYWRRISPVHKKLISTFHHGGDWEVLKQMCEDTNFYENIARDLRSLREAIQEAAVGCQLAASKNEQGIDEDPPMFTKAASLFQAMLLLISDGNTPDMLSGPDAWHTVGRVLNQGIVVAASSAASTAEAPPEACSSTASTAEAPPELKKAQVLPVAFLPS